MQRYEADGASFQNDARYLNPLLFWHEKKDSYPQLYQLALRFLSVPSTSVLSEQVFSGAGRISTKDRTCLGKTTIEQLVFLQRSLSKEDAMAVTPEDFREERRAIL